MEGGFDWNSALSEFLAATTSIVTVITAYRIQLRQRRRSEKEEAEKLDQDE